MEKNLYDLTNPQKSIWYSEQYYINSNINNICGVFCFNTSFDSSILAKSFNILVKENDSLRLRIVIKDSKPYQYISEFEEFDIPVVEVNSNNELIKLENQMASKPFNIIDSPLFCCKIFMFPNGTGGLILNMHHIASDGITLGLVSKKLYEIYKKLINNENIENNSDYNYRDYILSEKKYLQSEKFKKDELFWNDLYKTIPEKATIPSNTTNFSNEISSNRKIFSLSKEQTDIIKQYCKDNNVSLYNFFMSIFALYIGRVSNLNDFVIGTPILNRTNFKEKNTLGMFISTIPFRVTIQENATFVEYLRHIASNLITIFRHQKYPYQYLLENLRKKDKNLPNLYNILLSYQITQSSSLESEYSTDWIPAGSIPNDVEIQFYDFNDTGCINISYDYKTSKYKEKDIELVQNRISYIIKQILSNNNLVMKDISIVTPEEEKTITLDFNKTKQEYSNDTIINMFEKQVIKTPDNIALVFENKTLTYKQLNEKANSLAFYLKHHNGVLPNDLVGIMVNRSIEMIVGIIATLKAGAAYIPIDPTYPEDRINYMLKNSNSKVLLTQKKLENKVDFDNKLFIDLNNKDLYSNPNINLNIINSPDDLAYVIFTSGSTGYPKGVMLKHKSLSNLTNYCNNSVEYLKNSTYQTIVSITTVSFDIFIFETLISLQKGLKLVIANEQEQTNPILLNKLLKENQVTIIQSTPSRMQLFVDNIADIPSLKDLKYITLAGEQLPLSLVNSLKNLCNVVIYNGYGPSETTVFSTLTKIDNNIISIGKPLANTQIYILDNNLKPVPIGIAGEIYISGDGVGKGYLNNEELTKKSFINNPFIKNSIMYKTGDMGMFKNDGTIICLGRSDHQIKIRGLRIELGEIENKISELSQINSCVVVKKTNNASHEFLCAYYTTNTNIEVVQIRKYLEQYLPSYMIPQYFMELSDFPYTPNGKIDKKRLPEPKIQVHKKDIIPPRNDTDSKLIEILKKQLDIPSISIDDSFFELGGDSLYAINLSLIIQEYFNVQISSRDILENPIIQNLSNIITNKNNVKKQEKIEKIPQSEFYRISSAQKRIYFASQLDGKSSILYNIPCGIIINGNIDDKKLENCFKELINRHESLRTSFTLNDGIVVQHINENIDFNLETVNNISFDNLKDIFDDFIQPFDLSKAPLFRAKLIKFTNNKSAILVDMHHIISDGASLSILTKELSNLYNSNTLQKLDITYKDFAEFEYVQTQSDFYKESEKYWINQFSGEIPVLNMPTTYSRPAIQSFEGNKIYSTINSKIKNNIENLAQELNVTPYMILLAVYYILLSKYTSQDDIVIGSPIVNRDLLETQNLIGMFVNTLALRNTIDSNLSFKDFVLNLKNNLLDAYKYQLYPFDELVNKLNIKRDTSRNPLFDTMFIYQNNNYNNISFNGISSEYYIPNAKISKFDLSLEALPNDSSIKLTFEYATKLFSEEYIRDLSNHYLNILNFVLKNVDTKIENICMLSKDEKNLILNDFNSTKTTFDKNKTISQLFEEQVNKTPDNIAIVFGNDKLTFKELNEKSNSLANFLRNNGISNNCFVGIMINRSLEMVISILATIKAGGTYIPIDPSYPKDRIDYMLKSSNADILLTTKKLENNIDFKNKISVDLSNNEIYNLPNVNLININNPEDLIYCIFTSGSTGLPKGVMIPHRVISNFTNYCNHYVDYLNNPMYDTIVSITTVSFDLFVYEALISLQRGLKLVISNENEQTTPQLLNDLMIKNNATVLQSTPSIMQIFINNIDNMPALKKLKYAILSGEQLPLSLAQKLHKLGIVVYNGYGPSETHYCTLTKVKDDIITIGKPIDNSQMYILDKNLNPVPIGITGDIYISGDCVGKGYLNNKELTKKSFIKNPFLPDTMMYKSGDLGKYLNDGNIICLGRSDHQIKIRGLRIELEEIESLILKYPNISKVSVVKQSIQNREFISAYFVSTKRIVINELRKYLSRSLPRYMVPSYYTALDDLPYTPNGKIDKKALPLPTEILNVSREEYVAPKTKLQKQLVIIWEKILNTKPIGINDNFFELGGDSLLAMNLNMELQKFSSKVTYQDIFRFPTIAELEDLIESDGKKTMFSKVQNLSDNYLDVLKNSRKKEKIKKWYPHNVLLTGSTGFLGIHILDELLKNKDINIYCIIREEPGITANTKLHQKLHYYFGDKYDDLINTRIFAVTGNISKPGFGLNQEELLNLSNSIDVVVNSAANVAHYGNYTDFYNTNVVSVKYIIDFCKSFNKKLYHISTMGVAGRNLDESYPKYKKKSKVIFNESSLYIGQDPENIYTFTKFEAEVQILDAVSKGLDAYILRMGNLMPRYKDGVFQENLSDNAFINRLASFVRIGMVPDYMINNQLEFTPVDYAAKAVFKVMTHQTNTNRIFHLCNYKTISVSRCLKVLKKLNQNMQFLSEKDFINKINEILENENTKDLLKIIIDDFDENMHINYNTDMIIKSNFTIKYLRRSGFIWPRITNRYLINFLNILRRII